MNSPALPLRLPRRRVLSLLAAGLLPLALAIPAVAQQARAASSGIEGVAPEAMAQIQSLLADKERRTKAQQKLDSQLIYAARMDSRREVAPGVPVQEVSLLWHDGVDAKAGKRVLVDVRTNRKGADSTNNNVAKTIVALGGEVIGTYPDFDSIYAAMPLAQIEALAEMADVRFIQAARTPERDTGSVTSEGDRTMAADTARAAFPLLLRNVKVGVLSDSASATGISNSIASGNLAAGQVTVVPGQAGSGSDEGLAMLEIINDVAPGAQLFFATSTNTTAGFAQNIVTLRNTYGCDIIVDDIRFDNESPFQDDIVARGVNTVTASGAMYFASAGNSGNKTDGTSGTWVGDFTNGGAFTVPGSATSYEVHSFQTTPAVQNYNVVTTGGSSYRIIFYWGDPLGGSANDYDIFELNSTGTSVVTSSTTVQNGTQDPAEFTSSLTTGNRVVVVRKTGAAARALYVSTGRGRLSINTNGFARGHSAAIDAIALAAAPAAGAFTTGAPTGPFPGVYTASQAIETFSSDGPARKFHQPDGTPVTPGNFLIATGGGLTQQYPVVTAPDGVTTSVSGFAPFYGTSAAAPHAAAVAALAKAYNPNLTAAQIRAAMTSTALDIRAAGTDNDSGAGILRPVNLLSSLGAGYALASGGAATASGGNNNGGVDFNETLQLAVPITNAGTATAPSVSARLSTITPGVTIGTATASYGNIAGGATVSNTASPFVFTTSPSFAVGTPIQFVLTVAAGRRTYSIPVRVPTGSGVGAAQRFDYAGSPVPIPDNISTGASVPITVSGFNGVVGKVTVSFYVTHTYDSDLSFFLIAPDGTQLQLFGGVGGSGDNFGSAATPDTSRTTLDDAAATLITAGAAPFVGTFRPTGALSAFNGVTGANGTWTLKVVDSAAIDVGNVNAVSVFLSPVTGVNGGNP